LPSDSPSPADPTRVAIIDIGTNSTRILVADVSGNRVDEVERISTVTRLGRGVDHSGTLSPEAIEDVCDAIAGYLQLVERLGATRTRVVATSAVRDASNADAFTAELRERFDLVTDVISGDEEARLTYRGAISGRSGTDPLLVLDIGGGSTELIVGEGDTMLFHTSMQAGVVRHTERFITSDPPDPAELENLAARERHGHIVLRERAAELGALDVAEDPDVAPRGRRGRADPRNQLLELARTAVGSVEPEDVDARGDELLDHDEAG
jgi:exopolyphosphatase/pppGpp-phosphohydrolase